MKKKLLVLCLLAIGFLEGLLAQDNSIAKEYGVLPYNGKAILYNRALGGSFDTVEMKNGIGIYTPQQKHEGEIAWIYMTDVDRNYVHYLVAEKGTITLTATKDSMIFVTGTPNNDAFFALDKQLEPLRIKMKKLGREITAMKTAGETEKAEALTRTAVETADLWWDKQVKFAAGSRNLAGLNYVSKCLSRFSIDQLKQMLENYKDLSQNSVYRSVKNRYEAEVKTTIGIKAPDFNLPTQAGDRLALSSIRKKVLIVDFWASWCKPCRAENPNMLALYKKWHDRGLEILSVSIDAKKDKDLWLEAIKKDGLTWLQVWDDNAEVSKVYGITAIPRMYILDEKGMVLQKDLRGEELNKAIEGLMTK